MSDTSLLIGAQIMNFKPDLSKPLDKPVKAAVILAAFVVAFLAVWLLPSLGTWLAGRLNIEDRWWVLPHPWPYALAVLVAGVSVAATASEWVIGWRHRRALTAPAHVNAEAGDGAAVVSWTRPAEGLGRLGRYVITPRTSGAAQTATTVPARSALQTTSMVISGLTNDQAYTFRVAAVDREGTAKESVDSAAVTPAAGTPLPASENDKAVRVMPAMRTGFAVFTVVLSLLVILGVGILDTPKDDWRTWPWQDWFLAAVPCGVAAACLVRAFPRPVPPGLAVAVPIAVAAAVVVGGSLGRPSIGIIFGRAPSAVVSAGLLVALLVLLQLCVPGAAKASGSGGTPSGAATAYRRRGLRAAYVGIDGRVSTSQLQVVLWTLAVLYMLIHLFIQGQCLGQCPDIDEPEFKGLRKALANLLAGELHAEYWALLGFPAAAAVYARALTSGRSVVKADITANEQDGGLGQAVQEAAGDDAGSIDLGDTQYLLFSVVTLGFVLVSFLSNPAGGLPAVPGVLVGLVGVSAAAYATKKTAEGTVGPEITDVDPPTIVIAKTFRLEVRGRGFRRKEAEVSTATRPELGRVALKGYPLTVQVWQPTRIVADLPRTLTAWEAEGLKPSRTGPDGELTVDVVVSDDMGIKSIPYQVRLRRST